MRKINAALIVSLVASLAAFDAAPPALDGARGVAAASARAATTQEEGEDWFFVAVLRADGVVVPFATFWRGFWLTPWQGPVGYPPDVNSVANLPAAWFTDYEDFTADWYSSPARGRAPLRLRASRLVEVDNHCSKNWGFATDYRAAKSGAGRQYRNVGVALSAPDEIAAPVSLDARSRGLGPVVALVRKQFDEDERAWLARPDMAARAKSFPSRRERERRAPAFVSLARIDAGGGRWLYYFEAERRYPLPRGAQDAACENLSALGGLLLQTGGAAPRLVERQFALSDCDRKELLTGRPLGLISHGARRFLILEEHGYEDESYTIIELLRAGTLRRLRRIEGGGC